MEEVEGGGGGGRLTLSHATAAAREGRKRMTMTENRGKHREWAGWVGGWVGGVAAAGGRGSGGRQAGGYLTATCPHLSVPSDLTPYISWDGRTVQILIK